MIDSLVRSPPGLILIAMLFWLLFDRWAAWQLATLIAHYRKTGVAAARLSLLAHPAMPLRWIFLAGISLLAPMVRGSTPIVVAWGAASAALMVCYLSRLWKAAREVAPC